MSRRPKCDSQSVLRIARTGKRRQTVGVPQTVINTGVEDIHWH
jgi:hypothetical protein